MMSTSPFTIRPFDPVNATEAEYRAKNTFANRMQAERLPDDPPLPLSESIQAWRSVSEGEKDWAWHIWQDDETIVASAWVTISYVDNLHLAELELEVVPEGSTGIQGVYTPSSRKRPRIGCIANPFWPLPGRFASVYPLYSS